MIAYTTFLLCIIGIFSSIKVGVKADKVLSFLGFISLSFIFAQFCGNLFEAREDIFSFIWNSSPSGDIKIDIISNPDNYGLIFPFFAMTLLSAGANAAYRYEERRSAYNAVLIFNLTALIMMITSNNFVQLLCALFIIDILALFIMKDVEAYRRYVLLNMLADMILFTVLAVINSQVSSLDIREILIYKKIGQHLDFIAIAGLTAIFIKLGFFLYHIGMTELKNIRLHRLTDILFLSSPTAAFILLLKFHILWSGSTYFSDYINLICGISALWSFLSLLTIDNFKSKIQYLIILFWTLFVELLRFNEFTWTPEFTALLLEMYVLTGAMYLIFYYSNRKNNVSQMMKTRFINKQAMVFAGTLITLMILALTNTLINLYNPANHTYIEIFALLFILSLSAVIKQIFFTAKTTLEGIPYKIGFKWFPAGLLLLTAGGVLWNIQINNPLIWSITALFCAFCLWTPLSKSSVFYDRQGIQHSEITGKLYEYLLLEPLRFSGRFLWLLVDWVFIEKIIVGAADGGIQFGIRFFRKIHNSRLWGPTFIIAVTLALLWISFTWGRLP